ncbi:proton-coupled zinc antiporter SLC30A2 isoform X2 [Panthera pardus]|uniref:Proton-coupled zinc antiporter SLC30A2 n=2 Tax=Panthera TaxID=9688 RepID=A0A9V1ESX0_PANPR|nr:proton-coupled zinc antiporter SLC30A2 isoform X2 [Panthera pardus]
MRPAARGEECAQPSPSPESGPVGSSGPRGAGDGVLWGSAGALFAAGHPSPFPAGFCTRRAAGRFTRGGRGRIKRAGAGRSGGRGRAGAAGAAAGRPQGGPGGSCRAKQRAAERRGRRGPGSGARGPPGRWVRAAQRPARNFQGALGPEAARGFPDPAQGARGRMEPTERQHLMDARPGARSYTGSLWQEGAGWIPLPAPGLDLQAIELAAESNHYCHAQKGPDSHFDSKKEQARRQLYVASAICLVFMIGEVIGGYLAHSLAVMTDAAHLLTDFASMLVSLFSLWMSSRPATKTMNFGWQRAEILGALLSVLSIWVVTGVLVFLAVERLISGDYEVEGGTMLITSGCAVAVNIIMGLTLHQSGHGHSHDTSQQQENPSVRAAFIHVVGDFLQSLGILVAAYILYFKPEYKYVDPICTFLFSILVLGTTLTILRDVILVLMEAPRCPLPAGMCPPCLIRDPQGCGLHSCTGSAAVRGRGGSLAQPAYLGTDRVPARAVCPHRHRSECRRPGRAEGSQHLPAGQVPLPHYDHPD